MVKKKGKEVFLFETETAPPIVLLRETVKKLKEAHSPAACEIAVRPIRQQGVTKAKLIALLRTFPKGVTEENIATICANAAKGYERSGMIRRRDERRGSEYMFKGA